MEQHQETEPVVLGDFSVRKVTTVDPKTKRVAGQNPYKLIIHNGVRFFEHPVGSGNLWWEDRTPAGRLEAGKIFKGKKHEVYNAPLTSDEKLAREVAKTKQENERLLRELEEIKKEKMAAIEEKVEAAKKPAAKKVAAKAVVKEEEKAAAGPSLDDIIKG